jgi:hypothetical protein
MVHMRAREQSRFIGAIVVTLAVSAAFLMAGILAAPVKGAPPTTSRRAPAGYGPELTNESVSPTVPEAGSPYVLLIQDANPWGSTANQDTLTASGIPFDLINSGTFPGQDLTPYTTIMYGSDQPQGYYDTMAANIGKVETFVQNGGGLIAHCCDMGWNSGFWSVLIPGGVGHAQDYDSNNYIVDAAHPYCDGLTDADFVGSFCSHDYFTDLQPGTNVIMVNSGGEPTVIEYSFGAGTVLANTQTLEIAANFGWPFGQGALDNEMRYIPIMGNDVVIPGDDTIIQQVIELPPPDGHTPEQLVERSDLFDSLSWVMAMVAVGGVTVLLIGRRMRRD